MDNNIADALDLPVNLMSDEIEKQFLERARNLNLDFFAKKPSKLLMRSSQPSLSAVSGIVVVVDFPMTLDDGTQTTALQKAGIQISSVYNDFLGDMWNPSTRQVSVKSYFQKVSNGKLDLNCNVLMKAVLLDKEKEHYDDPSKSTSSVSREFVTDVLSKLLEDEELAALRQPILDAVTLDSGNAMSLNIVYAGRSNSTWNKGLWAHSWNLSSPVKFTKSDGTECQFKNYSVFGTSSSITTICHEIAHQVCKFPDLYESINGSIVAYGVGQSCLMGAGSVYIQDINPYFKLVQGWIDPIDISDCTQTRILDTPCNGETVYIYKKSSSEFFLIQHSRKSRIGNLDGIVIWRVNTAYSSNTGSRVVGIGDDQHARGLLVQIVEPDGSYSLQRNDVKGSGLMWGIHSNDEFSDSTCPTAKWYDGTSSGLKLVDFRSSSNGATARCILVPRDCNDSDARIFSKASQLKVEIPRLKAGIDYDLVVDEDAGNATVYGKGSYRGSKTVGVKFSR